jgi:hypothetical protein
MIMYASLSGRTDDIATDDSCVLITAIYRFGITTIVELSTRAGDSDAQKETKDHEDKWDQTFPARVPTRKPVRSEE